MKTTLKVAELASFIYAFLFFGSFCINAVYYGSFGIDITAYMQTSEILLLFLGQPILYIPVLLCLLFVLTTIRPWPQEQKSFKAKYALIADANDGIVMTLTFFSLLCIPFWYDVKFAVFGYYFLVVFVVLSFMPSFMNAFWRNFLNAEWQGFLIIWNSIKYTVKNRKFPKWSIKRRRRWLRKEGEKPKRNADLTIRWYMLEVKLPEQEKRQINWVYAHRTMYLIIVIYFFSILTMCMVNVYRADGIKAGELSSGKKTELTFSIPQSKNLSHMVYVGESQQYVFLYQRHEQRAYVINRNLLTIQAIESEGGKNSFYGKHMNKEMQENPFEFFKE